MGAPEYIQMVRSIFQNTVQWFFYYISSLDKGPGRWLILSVIAYHSYWFAGNVIMWIRPWNDLQRELAFFFSDWELKTHFFRSMLFRVIYKSRLFNESKGYILEANTQIQSWLNCNHSSFDGLRISEKRLENCWWQSFELTIVWTGRFPFWVQANHLA